MTFLTDSQVIHNPFRTHHAWDRRLLQILSDALLVLVGIATSIGVCRSFMDWLKGPPDSAAFTAIAILVGAIASTCWLVRYTLLATILSPRRAANQRKPEEH